MRLTYKPAFSISLGPRTIVSVKFSICGTMLIATTTDLRACVWDISTGQQFYPEVEFDSPALSLLWITDNAVLVGLANGTLVTFMISIASRTLRVLEQHVTNTPIFYLSYQVQPSESLLAVGGGSKVRLLTCQPPHGLQRLSIKERIPDPREPLVGTTSQPLPIDVKAVEWLPWAENRLLVMYRHHGICIWDVQTHISEQSLRFEAPLLGGTLCPKIQKFAARTIHGEMQIYGFPLNAEQVWLPKEPRQISSLHPIHAGTSIIVGTRGRAIIVDIQKTLLVQILSHDDSDTTEIRSLACYNDKNDRHCMVATASDQSFIVWKSQGIWS